MDRASARERGDTASASARALAPFKAFWVKAYEDGVTGLAGMVAYNLLLSLLPLTLVALFVLSKVLSSVDVEDSVIRDLHRILPSTEGANLTGLLRGLESSSTGIGIAALVSSIWVGASFWGALDTAFCRIYGGPCRSWLAQKRFALTMLLFVIVFIAATLAVPALQSVVAQGARDLPFGLDAGPAVYVLSLVVGLLLLFGTLSVIYAVVPLARLPWRAVWPGALGATLAIAVVDYGFPVYLSQSSVIASFSSTYVFVLIVLVWFYAVSIVILAGAVINALRAGPPGRTDD
jgi:membrane protein